MVGNSTDPFAKPFLEQIQRGGKAMRRKIHDVLVRAPDELDGAIATIARQKANAIIIQGSLPPKATVDLAIKYRLPAFTNQRTFAEAGALTSYSASFGRAGSWHCELCGQDHQGSQTCRSAGAAAEHV